jgi:hypothetical protein
MESVVHCRNCSGHIESNGFSFCDINCFDEFMQKNNKDWKINFQKPTRKITPLKINYI